MPARACIATILLINLYNSNDPDNQCIGCDPVQDTGCPATPDMENNKAKTPCQELISDMHWNCDGVVLPDGYYYDPQRTITGAWGADGKASDVKTRLNVAIGRCGCVGSGVEGIRPSRGATVLVISAAALALIF